MGSALVLTFLKDIASPWRCYQMGIKSTESQNICSIYVNFVDGNGIIINDLT